MGTESETGDPARLAWWPAERDKSGDKQPLTRAQIVATAVKLFDAEGIEGFSMRRLGRELGAGATSFYWHVKDKDQLIDLVLDEIIGEVPLDDDPAAPWRDRAMYLARQFRDTLLRHRHMAPVFGARVFAGPNILRAWEHILAVLKMGGLEGDMLGLSFAAIINYTTGSAVMEAREPSGPGTAGKSLAEVQAVYIETLGSLPADEYPNLTAMIAAVTRGDPTEIDEDAQFEYGLRMLFDGIESDLSNAGAYPIQVVTHPQRHP
jgi:AcrR family transcriptional regulator